MHLFGGLGREFWTEIVDFGHFYYVSKENGTGGSVRSVSLYIDTLLARLRIVS